MSAHPPPRGLRTQEHIEPSATALLGPFVIRHTAAVPGAGGRQGPGRQGPAPRGFRSWAGGQRVSEPMGEVAPGHQGREGSEQGLHRGVLVAGLGAKSLLQACLLG